MLKLYLTIKSKDQIKYKIKNIWDECFSIAMRTENNRKDLNLTVNDENT